MNLPATSNLLPEQIAAEVAEMRKAARAISASSRKRLEFLRQVGVLESSNKRHRSKRKLAVVSGHH